MPLVLNGTTGINTDGQGNLTFSGTGQRIVGDFSNATLASRVYFQNTTSAQTALGVLPGSGFAIAAVNIFSQSDPANSALLQMRIENTVDARISSGVTGTGSFVPMTFYTGGSERMRLDTSGNLGIGTSSPTHRLQVAGSGTVTSFVGTTDTSGTAIGRFRATYAGGGGGTASAVDLRAGDGYTYLLTESNVPMLFGTNNAERMRIDSAGNVGIGTNSPGTRLQVASGTSATSVTVSNTSGGSEWQQNGNDLYITNYNASGAAVFRTNGTSRLVIDSGGNIRMGDGSAADTSGRFFDIYNTGSSAGAYAITRLITQQVASTNTTSVDIVKYKNGIFAINNNETNSAACTVFGIGGSERARIDSSGNLGIGTSSPSSRLDLAGGVLTTRGGEIRANNTGSAATLTLTGGNSFAGGSGAGIAIRGYTVGYNNGGMEFYYGNGSTTIEAARIDSSGNLLVGTTGTIQSGRVSVASGSSAFTCTISGNTGVGVGLDVQRTVQNGDAAYFRSTTGLAGFITITGANTCTYNSVSDVRLKENIVDAPSALAKVNSLQVRSFVWKDGTGAVPYGFIAQELNEVIPEAVSQGTTDENGSMLTPWGVDTSLIVPYLTKAIQEQQAIIEQLKADVAALKGTA